jgi:hypothetical protein
MLLVKKILISFILLSICSHSGIENNSPKLTKVAKKDFPKVIELKGEPILTEDYNHHHKIFVIDKYLMTLVNSGKYQYHVFDKRTHNYLGPIGLRGQGPNEWEIPQTTLGQFEKTNDAIMFWNFDYLRGNFNKINLTKTLATKSIDPVIEKTIRINMREFPYFQLFQGKESDKIYATGWIYEANRVRLKSYNPTDHSIRKSALFPRINNSNHLPSEVMNSLYGGSFGKHPNQDKFVQAMFTFNRIDIFDENLNVINSIVDGENWRDGYFDGKEMDITRDYLSPLVDGYNGLAVSENFIFALEAKENIGTEEEKENESFIRVFNWDGKPLAYFEIPHDLSSIDIDESNGYLYATDYQHELVLRFNISNQIKEWLK